MWYELKQASPHRDVNNPVTSPGWVRAAGVKQHFCVTQCVPQQGRQLLSLCISPTCAQLPFSICQGKWGSCPFLFLLSSVMFSSLLPSQLFPYNVGLFRFWLDIYKLPHLLNQHPFQFEWMEMTQCNYCTEVSDFWCLFTWLLINLSTQQDELKTQVWKIVKDKRLGAVILAFIV